MSPPKLHSVSPVFLGVFCGGVSHGGWCLAVCGSSLDRRDALVASARLDFASSFDGDKQVPTVV